MNNVVISALLLLLVSCGPNVSRHGTREKLVPLTDLEVQTIKLFQSFSCESILGENCPGGIGRVIVLNYKNKNKTKFCSAFLTSNKTMVTNNHCVATKEDCANAVISFYNGSNAETVSCKSIIFSKSDSSTVKNRRIDVSVIELSQEIKSDYFKVSASSAKIGEPLKVWAVDQMSAFNARITELKCHYANNTISMSLSNCPAIGGNSGSPVLNSENEVVGVLFGGTDYFKMEEDTPLMTRREMREYSLSTDVAYFRNYILQ